MNSGMRDSTMRELTEQELDAISGGSAYEGLQELGSLIQKTAFLGAAIIIGVANYTMKNGA